jgi:prolyl-tRNA synthetase
VTRMSALFGVTLREAPARASSAAAALLARAGYLRELPGGLRTWLPLGVRALARIRAEIQDALAAGLAPLQVQEVAAPVESLAALCRSEVRSWRHLPRVLLSWQGDAAELLLLAPDAPGVDALVGPVHKALQAAFERAGARPVALGDRNDTSWAHVAPDGDTEIVQCDSCSYAAECALARFARPRPAPEEPRPLTKVATPNAATIAELCAFLRITPERTAKAVLLVDDTDRFIFAVVRGDREVSEGRLRLALGASSLRPATEAEIRAAGAVPGYASPIGLAPSAVVVVDAEAAASANLVAGANEQGFHLENTNAGRDYKPTLVAEIAALPDPVYCPRCGATLQRRRAFALTSVRTGRTDVLFQDKDGKERPVHAAGMTVHLGAVLLAAADARRDDAGLLLPAAAAPFDLHVVSLGGAGTEPLAAAEKLALDAEAAGARVLLDDRDESPGVQFADADLMGIPLRVTLSARSLKAGGAEVKRRDQAERTVVPLDEVVRGIRAD